MEKKPRTTEPSKQSQRRISRQMNKHWILLSIGSINSELREPQMTVNTSFLSEVQATCQSACPSQGQSHQASSALPLCFSV